MFDAQYLIAPSTNFKILGPWMSREGDNAVFAVDLISETLSAGSFKINIRTKAADDAGDGGGAIAVIDIAHGDGPDRYEGEVNATLKDLVRYEFEFTSAAVGTWVLFRMLPATWFDSVSTS